MLSRKGGVMSTEKIKLSIKSPAFASGQFILQKYAGEGVNPPLSFENIPEATKSLVLIVDDPDAPRGTFDHWIVFNIPKEVRAINEGEVPEGASLGINSTGGTEYLGPSPPPGKAHRYFFKLYALNIILPANAGEAKSKVEKDMQGHILGEGSMVGLYRR